ncbi:MAG: hypothetical protein ABJC74_11665 [Gemmatimonadota bacterium]
MSKPHPGSRFTLPLGIVLLAAAWVGCNSPTINDNEPGGGGGGAGVASRVHITGQPSAVLAGHAIVPAIRVVIADSSLVAITSSSAPVTLSLVPNNGAALHGTVTRNASSGTAILSGVSVDSVGLFQIIASSPGLASDTSTPFVVGVPVTDTITIDLGSTTVDTVGQIVFVSERNHSVNPAVDTLPVGGVIHWHWRGSRTHGVVLASGIDPLFYVSGDFVAAKELFLTMGTAGSYSYTCSVHGTAMTGSVVVQ